MEAASIKAASQIESSRNSRTSTSHRMRYKVSTDLIYFKLPYNIYLILAFHHDKCEQRLILRVRKEKYVVFRRIFEGRREKLIAQKNIINPDLVCDLL